MSNDRRNDRRNHRDRDRTTDSSDATDLEILFLKLIAVVIGMK
jgi:hypothetical protein